MREIWLIAALAAGGSVEKVTDEYGVQTETNALFIRRGEMQMFGVSVLRQKGDSDVDIVATNLPAGVTADPLTISGDITSGMLVLHADDTATEGVAMVQVNGQIGDLSEASQPLRLLVGGAPGSLDESFATGGK